MARYCYLTFPGTYFALHSEAVLHKTAFSFKLVPVPRDISSSCGVALRCSCTDLAGIVNALDQSNVQVEGSFKPGENNRYTRFIPGKEHDL